MEQKNIDEIIPSLRKLGLDTIKVEYDVIEVKNKHDDVNIDSVKRLLKRCILIISKDKKYKKNNKTGIFEAIDSVYYILLNYDDEAQMLKYHKVAKKELDRNALIDSYDENPEPAWHIDTIYCEDEIRTIEKHENSKV